MFETIAPLLAGTPWAINPHVLEAILATRLDLIPEAALPSPRQSGPPPRTGVAVLPIRGAITQHEVGGIMALLFGGGASIDSITQDFRALMADETVRGIVLDIDSPGGTAFGVAELAAEIHHARGRKPVVALANSTAASAAYWLGSSADEFYVTPSGMAGSIGVYVTHMDLSGAAEKEGVKPTIISAGKYKTEGNEFAPLDDEGRASAQAFVNSYYDLFVHDVARNRGATEAQVRNGYGEGRVLTAKDAVKAGLVDGVRTFDQVLARIGQGGRPRADDDVAATTTIYTTDNYARVVEWMPPFVQSNHLTYVQESEHALTSVQGFVARSRSLADLRAQEGRPLGEAAKGALVSFIEALDAETQQAKQLLSEQPDARERQNAEALALLELQALRYEALANARAVGVTI